jgi:hypothetical protein
MTTPHTLSNVIDQRQDLETLLLGMRRYGEPRVHYHNGGWASSVEIATTQTGAEFTIRSEFGLSTPTAAAKQCHERMIKALSALGGKK